MSENPDPVELATSQPLEAFAKNALEHPESIKWDEVTQAERDAIARAGGYEPIDWSHITEEDRIAADRSIGKLNLTYKSPIEDIRAFYRSCVMIKGYDDDYNNELRKLPHAPEDITDDTIEEFIEYQSIPTLRMRTLTERKGSGASLLAITNPVLHQAIDKAVIAARNAAESGDRATVRENLSKLISIREEASDQYRAVTEKSQRE